MKAVTALLATGFPQRSAGEWARGLGVLRARVIPATLPRYGLMLEAEGRPVGVLLMMYSAIDGHVRCNLSSWYVLPAFSPYAALLLNAALNDRTVTYLNLTPAPRTTDIIEAQGFRSFCHGSMLYLPSLSWQRERARVVPFGAGHAEALAEGDLLRDHAAMGCHCLVVEAADGLHPFVFAPSRRLRGLLPSAHLLYCRSLLDAGRFAGVLGRALLRRGIFGMLVAADEPVPGLAGRRVNAAQSKYVFGPHPPEPGDLAFTELAIFGG